MTHASPPALFSGLLGLAALLALGGCVERQPLSAEERRQVAEYVTSETPSPDHEVSIDLGGKVKLVGWDLSPEPLRAGEEATVTWYWQVVDAPGKGWKAFTHVGDGGGGQPRMNLDGEGPVRRLLPAERWESGAFIRDPQTFTVPADWVGDEVPFYVGLWKGSDRMPVVAGPSDGDDRARVATVPVVAGDATGDDGPGTATIPRARGDVEIDGRLDEDAWKHALETGPFVDTLSGGEANVRATGKLLWDDDALYVAVEVADPYLKSTFEAADDHLWTEDAVELMIDPDADGRNYFEIQVSPTGVVFDTRYDTRRQPGPFGHLGWTSGIVARTALSGTVNDDEADEGWLAELRVPWTAFAHGDPPAERPEAGAIWGMNLYVMDARERGQLAAGWSAPKVGDFHVPARFVRVRFGAPPRPEPRVLRPLEPGVAPNVIQTTRPTPAELLRRQREMNKIRPGAPSPIRSDDLSGGTPE